jgi:hypothetical protein
MYIHWLRIFASGLTIVAKFAFVPFKLLRGPVAAGLRDVILFGITEPLPEDSQPGEEERKFETLKLIIFCTRVERNFLEASSASWPSSKEWNHLPHPRPAAEVRGQQ